MVNDTEPRYRLVDANGNVVGSLFAESDGTLKLQEGTSGNDNELSFGTDGTLGVEQTTTEKVKPQSGDQGLDLAVVDLADDSATTVDRGGHSLVFLTSRTSGVAVGIFFVGFDTISTVDDLGVSNQGNTTLSGTTGPDGSVNVAVDGNTLYVENRFSSQEKFIIYLLGN